MIKMYDLTKPHCNKAHQYKEIDLYEEKLIGGRKELVMVKQGEIRNRCIHKEK